MRCNILIGMQPGVTHFHGIVYNPKLHTTTTVFLLCLFLSDLRMKNAFEALSAENTAERVDPNINVASYHLWTWILLLFPNLAQSPPFR